MIRLENEVKAMDFKYIAEISHTKPLEKIAVHGKLLNVYPFEGDDLYRLHCDDGIVDEVVYLYKKVIEEEELLKYIGKEIVLEGYVSLITRNKDKSIFCFDIKLKN